MYLAKKPLRFVKIVVFLRLVFPVILSEISPYAFFWSKKKLKTRRDLAKKKKAVTFCEKCRSIIRGFP